MRDHFRRCRICHTAAVLLIGVLVALLLGGCASPHTALLCFPVTVGPQDALWCGPTDQRPSAPPPAPRKPDVEVHAR